MKPSSLKLKLKLTTMNNTRSLFALISLTFLFLLSFNGASLRIPSLSPPQKLAGDPFYSPESRFYNPHLRKSLSSEIESENSPFHSPESPFYNPILRKSLSYQIESENSPENRNKKLLKMLSGFGSSRRDDFPARVNEFFHKKNETSSCKIRFFMTWISSSNSFNKRSIQSIESVFKSHPKACLLIISNSLDSIKGRQILQPFVEKRFRVTSIAPDFSYLFKNTMAESWFSKLIRGQVQVGNVPLGQNLSNLVRLCLLYKYGGVYIDADVIVLNRFDKVKNAIGAQSIDPNSKKWTRLNNAVMVFDKMHPLVYKFIEEFALTFNGNKWGHNGPFMVSRVVSRLQGRPGYKFTVLPPSAFYPVSWVNIRALFRGPKNETDLRWSTGVFEQIRNHSYTLHLWNKQSIGFRVDQGSVVSKIFLDTCVFCNASRTNSTI